MPPKPASVFLAALATTCVSGCVADDVSSTEQAVKVPDELKRLRSTHARYNDFANAIADGYRLGFNGAAAGCVALPGVGAMGYHYFNYARMMDPAIVEAEPEVLVYHTRPDGTLKLGAVEWVVKKEEWEAAFGTAPPEVFPEVSPEPLLLHVINPVLNWYVGHAWLFVDNPAGLFEDWNPEVTCP